MQAAVLTGIRAMDIIDVPTPAITNDSDVLIRVGTVGICGSDVHYYTTGRIGSQVVQYPYRVGHEFSGTVIETGPAVRNIRTGDRVAVDPAMPCHACDQCRAGREHTCRSLRFLGCPGQAEGCLSEYMVMPAHCCFPVGTRTSLDQAALIEPLSIGVYAVRQSVPMTGAVIGILGSGPIGLSVLLPALAGGAARAYVTDRIDNRLAAAAGAGAAWTGNPDKTDVVTAVTDQEPLLLDCVFECCGQQDALDQAVDLLKPGGKLMLVGIPETDRIDFNIDKLRRKEICIQNVRRQNLCVPPAIELLESGRIQADFMLTHHFALNDAKAAFDLVADYADGVIKAVINMDPA